VGGGGHDIGILVGVSSAENLARRGRGGVGVGGGGMVAAWATVCTEKHGRRYQKGG